MEQKVNIEQFKGQTRLPEIAIPKHYHLYLKTDLSECIFSGTVAIDLSITKETNFLVLNALELAIHPVSFTAANDQIHKPSHVIVDSEDEILVLLFDSTLCAGEGVLSVEFSAPLNNHLRGFYKCAYKAGGVKKNMAATQFEAVDARRCFPCWDEPALKATFKITLDIPSELMALSNMPVIDEKLEGNIKSVSFEKSPVMSTYLVAFVIGLFDYIEDHTAEGTKVRVYCPKETKIETGRYSLYLAIKVLDMFTEYFSMSYPLPKLDMVAVPEFSGGAMENYGLIIYRENLLLRDDLRSAAASKQTLTIVVSHEVAHQWFGNLVTMEWWNDLWLNEGFATWVSYMATDRLFPEWNIWTQFLRESSRGLRMDSLEQSHPIEMEIHPARSVEEKFDSISYEKGSTVICMLQSYIGDEIFQKSLRKYINRYAWKNAKTDDLWDALSEESSVPVKLMMDTWTKQKGYPVISVKASSHILELEQSQFSLSGIQSDGQWIVPITLSLGSYKNCKNLLLEKKVDQVDVSDLIDSFKESLSLHDEKSECERNKNWWIKINVNQSGFYRGKYDTELAARLRRAIETNCLSERDKFGILDDAYALCEAGEESLSSLLSLMDVYRKELDCAVMSRLVDVCTNLANIASIAIPDLLIELKQFFINILRFSAEKLGWESIPGESHVNAMLRAKVYLALVTLDDEKTHEEAIQRFQAFLDDKNTTCLSADMRKAVYTAVMRNASSTNRAGFESLLNVCREAEGAEEKEQVLRCIASCPDPDILKEVLNFLVSDEVREQDIVYGLGGISFECRQVAWSWVKENWNFILDKYGGALLLTYFVRDIVTPLCSNEEAEDAESFFETRVVISIAMNVKQGIEQIRIKARWIEHIKEERSLHDLLKGLASKK